jgi:hypothetical protein
MAKKKGGLEAHLLLEIESEGWVPFAGEGRK